MIARLKPLQEEFVAKGWPPIKIGVGLNTGLMTVGNMGSEFRMAYTVMGDAVNLGSRLESITKQYGVDIIVSEFTREKLPQYLFRELDRVRVKGKDEPVGLFEPICLAGEEDEAVKKELDLYHETLKLYRTQNWDMAEMQFVNLQKLSPNRYLYEVYLERIASYREDPPGADWDGVYTAKSK
jgi:adenylate cyclase